MNKFLLCFLVSISLGLLGACSEPGTAWQWQLPDGFPQPPVPEDNPMTVEKVTLGKKLFFDTALSGNQQQACASCHLPEKAFSESLPTSIGSTGERHSRNALSLVNVAYNATFNWAHPELKTLERQILIPLFNEAPVEMGVTGKVESILQRLQENADYPALFAAAFPKHKNPVNLDNSVKALASFVRSLVSFQSRFDRYAYYNEDILTAQELRGLELFMSERTECKHCHSGFNFSLSTVHGNNSSAVRGFHNTGLYAEQSAVNFDRGVFDITSAHSDKGLFRPPSLRNIALTAPYMHDGSITSLEEVIDFYAAGGRKLTDGPYPGDGRAHKNKSIFLHGFAISAQEKADLMAFLHTLTDEAFLARW